MAAEYQNGGLLRLVNCPGARGSRGEVYYALIRRNAIVLKFYPMLLD
jgi:hypothetical protein